jgi:membrane protein implicated in regulation of membrane protease activity
VWTFIIIGAVGLAVLLFSTALGEFIELGDGAVSGTSLGAGAVTFGAIGAIVTVNDVPVVWAYVASAVVALLVVLGVQRLISTLRASEDGQPRQLTGVQGMVTTRIPATGQGEVSLDDPLELERRLAWADVDIPEGTRVVVLQQSGSRVKVAPADD